MSNIAIRVENLGKRFELGELGTASDLIRKARGLGRRLLGFGRDGHAAARPWEDETDPNAFWALKGIDFEVNEGEVLGIIGRNGAGKSTLLKILSRITAPSCGRIEAYGRIASLLEVGTGFHQELTGRENIYLNGSILGMTRAEINAKLDEIIDFAGVEKFVDTPVKRYSSGMKVRLGFAVAAHLEPEILIVDEVLSVGDVGFQRKCLGKMNAVANSGRTVLFVSHVMPTIQALCSRAILLDDGRVALDSDASSTVGAYLASFSDVASSGTLGAREDRGGNGRVRFTDIEVISPQGMQVGSVSSGGPVVFRIDYEVKGEHAGLESVVVCIELHDEHDQTVGLYRTNFTGQNFRIGDRRGSFECRLEHLPLTIGSYRIDLFMSASDAEVLDYVQGAETLTVEGGDFFGTGSPGQPSHCRILTPFQWAHSPGRAHDTLHPEKLSHV